MIDDEIGKNDETVYLLYIISTIVSGWSMGADPDGRLAVEAIWQ